jgi:hypothetical protein
MKCDWYDILFDVFLLNQSTYFEKKLRAKRKETESE